jgi:hypothetical protein
LGVSESTVSRDYSWLDEQLRAQSVEDIRTWRGLQLARIERLIQSVWSDAIRGRYGAVDRVVSLMRRQAELLGLDAPQKIDVHMNMRLKAEQVAQEQGLDVDKLVAEAERILGLGHD